MRKLVLFSVLAFGLFVVSCDMPDLDSGSGSGTTGSSSSSGSSTTSSSSGSGTKGSSSSGSSTSSSSTSSVSLLDGKYLSPNGGTGCIQINGTSFTWYDSYGNRSDSGTVYRNGNSIKLGIYSAGLVSDSMTFTIGSTKWCWAGY